jgi:hypothetical protein
MESYLVAVERIHEYSKMEMEGTETTEKKQPPDAWPSTGCLTFNHVWMR